MLFALQDSLSFTGDAVLLPEICICRKIESVCFKTPVQYKINAITVSQLQIVQNPDTVNQDVPTAYQVCSPESTSGKGNILDGLCLRYGLGNVSCYECNYAGDLQNIQEMGVQ